MRAFEILGIVLLRFRPLPRIWAVFLIAVNAGSLIFIDTVYGQLNLLAILAGITVMIIIHARLGFVRLLGIGHIFWVPMLIWFVQNLPDRAVDPLLHFWVLILIVSNTGSLVIDAADVWRFIRGERTPHYVWRDGPA